MQQTKQSVPQRQAPAANISELWLTNKEVIAQLKVTDRTLRNWRSAGLLQCSKIGGKIYFKRTSIEAILENGNRQMTA